MWWPGVSNEVDKFVNSVTHALRDLPLCGANDLCPNYLIIHGTRLELIYSSWEASSICCWLTIFPLYKSC